MANTKITLQKVFTAGWRNFVIRNRLPSRLLNPVSNTSDCCYFVKDANGIERRCVIGWTLSKDQIKKVVANGLVTNGVAGLMHAFPLWFSEQHVPVYSYKRGKRELAETVDLETALINAQDDLHDLLCTASGTWKAGISRRKRYEAFAKRYGLKIPTIREKPTKGVKKAKKSTGLTLQSIFNAAYRRFIYNKARPAFDSNIGGCLYLDKATGNRCAVGAALTTAQIKQIEVRTAKTMPDLPIEDQISPEVCVLVDEFPEWFSKTALERKYTDADATGPDEAPMSFVTALTCLQTDLHDDYANSEVWPEVNFLKEVYDDFAKRFGLTIPKPLHRKK